MLVVGGANQPTVGGDELGGEQVVAREPMHALEPAGAAAEREPRDAGGGDATAGRREPVRLRRAVHRPPGGAAADARDPPFGIDVDVVHAANVEDEPVVA